MPGTPRKDVRRLRERIEDDLTEGRERTAAGFREYVEAFRANTDAALVVHDLEEPPATARQEPAGRLLALVRGIDEELRRLSSAYPGVYSGSSVPILRRTRSKAGIPSSTST